MKFQFLKFFLVFSSVFLVSAYLRSKAQNSAIKPKLGNTKSRRRNSDGFKNNPSSKTLARSRSHRMREKRKQIMAKKKELERERKAKYKMRNNTKSHSSLGTGILTNGNKKHNNNFKNSNNCDILDSTSSSSGNNSSSSSYDVAQISTPTSHLAGKPPHRRGLLKSEENTIKNNQNSNNNGSRTLISGIQALIKNKHKTRGRRRK